VILIKYSYGTAKARVLYDCRDGPAGQPTDDLPNVNGFGVVHGTVPELAFPVYSQSGLQLVLETVPGYPASD
jgi:hypothetical protein